MSPIVLAPKPEEQGPNKGKQEKEKEKPPRGLWEREPGSGIWWIRFRDADSKLHREKVGRKSDAQALLDKRRNDRRAGKKMPENIRTAPIKFEKLADYITEEYSDKHHSDSRNVKQRLAKLKKHFGDREAESIKLAEIDNWLSKNTKTRSTANRYRAAMSLAYREGIRNGRVKSNTARLVKQRKEGGNVIRFFARSRGDCASFCDCAEIPGQDVRTRYLTWDRDATFRTIWEPPALAECRF